MHQSELIGITTKAFQSIVNVQELWYTVFGSEFRETWTKKKDAYERIITKARDLLDAFDESDDCKIPGHVSLFFKDPLSDRLILYNSTSENLKCDAGKNPDHNFVESSNFDTDKKYCYYQLCDSLCESDCYDADEARHKRGLTGWVAVSGLPLKINNERDEERLKEIRNISVKYGSACGKYGTPYWGNHISEEKRGSRENWSNRYLAVPIISVLNQDKIIGVLRYSRDLRSKEIGQIDTPILESIASLLAAVYNLDKSKILNTRENDLGLEITRLQHISNYCNFLNFTARAYLSEISSLYLYLPLEKKPVLRLFDAVGISGSVNKLRSEKKIADYYDKERRPGLTWEIFSNSECEPVVYNNVTDSENWWGRNTNIFYGEAFRKVGISDLGKLADGKKNLHFLKNYPIKFMGIGLRWKGHPIGVLKVEFPSTFDSEQHYNEEDKVFFKKCATRLENEISKFYGFIMLDEAEWKRTHAQDFLKYVFEVIRTQLFSPDEHPEFWKKVKSYINQHKKEIEIEGLDLISRLPDHGNEVDGGEIPKHYQSYLTRFVTNLAIQYIIKILC